MPVLNDLSCVCVLSNSCTLYSYVLTGYVCVHVMMHRCADSDS